MCRFTRPFYDHLLVQQWMPAIGGLAAKLECGARWADVGCGAGLALIRLAQAFPNSTFVGYDSFDGPARARAPGRRRGAGSRIVSASSRSTRRTGCPSPSM